MIWSLALAAVGVLGIYLSGKKNYWGWGIGLGAQVLWIVYAVVTQQWGFIISALAYGWVYGKNFLAWQKEAQVVSHLAPDVVWEEAYRQGVVDERTSAAWGTDYGPNRNNPYVRQR